MQAGAKAITRVVRPLDHLVFRREFSDGKHWPEDLEEAKTWLDCLRQTGWNVKTDFFPDNLHRWFDVDENYECIYECQLLRIRTTKWSRTRWVNPESFR